MKFLPTPSLLYRIVKYALFWLLCIFLLLYVLPFYVLVIVSRYNANQTCVELPNGLTISDVALFDPKEYFWVSRSTLKLSDGTLLIENEDYISGFHFSESTLYGRVKLNDDTKKDYDFAFRSDVGLVFEREAPDQYKKLKEEAGPLIVVIPSGKHTQYDRRSDPPVGFNGDIVYMNLEAAYRALKKDPAYQRENCPQDFFPQ